MLLLLYKINNKQRDAKNTIYKKQPKIKKKSIGIPVIYMCVLHGLFLTLIFNSQMFDFQFLLRFEIKLGDQFF